MLSVLLLAYLKAELTSTFFLSSFTFKILLFPPIIKSSLYTPKKFKRCLLLWLSNEYSANSFNGKERGRFIHDTDKGSQVNNAKLFSSYSFHFEW